MTISALPQPYNRNNKNAKYDVQRKTSYITSIYLGCYVGYLIYSVTSFLILEKKTVNFSLVATSQRPDFDIFVFSSANWNL